MYYTPVKCFRVTWSLWGRHLRRLSIPPSRGTSRDQKFQFCCREKFWVGARAQTYITSLVGLWASFGPFLPKSEMMFFQKVPFCVRPFLAFFAHFRPILCCFWTSEASKHRKHTNCTYLCAKSSNKYMKLVSYSYLEIWPSQGPKNPTGPKNAPKMTGESYAPHVV